MTNEEENVPSSRLNAEEAKRLLGDFLRAKRTSPYYTFVSVLFAVIVGRIAQWIPDITKLFMPSGKSSVRPDLMMPTTQVVLALLVFLYVIHMWLYFTRVFIYLKETASGETFTFLLGFIVLAAASSLPVLWKHWAFVLGACTAAICAKTAEIWFALRKSPNHPFNGYARRWTGSTIFYIIALVALGIFTRTNDTYSLVVALVVLGAFSFRIFVQFRDMEGTVTAAITNYATQNPHEFSNPL